jgi:hypothetical protein
MAVGSGPCSNGAPSIFVLNLTWPSAKNRQAPDRQASRLSQTGSPQPHPECPTSFSLSSRLGILTLRKLRYRRSCILEVASYQPRRQAEACRTFAAAYSVRAKPGALVCPCTWEEVERGEVAPRSFTIRNMAQRIENVGRPLVRLAEDETIVAIADGAVG